MDRATVGSEVTLIGRKINAVVRVGFGGFGSGALVALFFPQGLGRWLWRLISLLSYACKCFGLLIGVEQSNKLRGAFLWREERCIERKVIRAIGVHALQLPTGEANVAIASSSLPGL